MESSSCIVCGNSAVNPWLDQCEDLYLLTPHRVNYGVCSVCHLVQQVPVSPVSPSFYPDSYPMHHSRGRLFMLARKLLIRRVYFDPGPVANKMVLLDFGCGDGSYLESISGKVGRRIGFEASPHLAKRLVENLQCEVFSDSTEALEALDSGVDTVTAHFVLEHLTDLEGTFRFWSRVLKPGGKLHLVVPNINSWEARLFGRKWHGLDSPRHISFPGGENLAILAGRHGFRVEGRSWGIFPNTWAASFATVIAGHYHHMLFIAFIPLGMILAFLFPQSTAVYELRKND